jgi:uncharacterized protein YbaR (Trm112 family)
MKKELVNILCCPTCKGELGLKIEKEENGEIQSGTFTCAQCGVTYPIVDGIPNLLPKEP